MNTAMTKKFVIMLTSTMGSVDMHERVECEKMGHAIQYGRTLLSQHADEMQYPGEEMFFSILRDKAGRETEADRIWVEYMQKKP